MHRSGTSTVSGILYMLGLDLGKAVMGSNESNSRGFFENYRIMSFNEALFRKLHVNWHNTLGLQEAWWESDEMRQETEQLKMLIQNDYTLRDLLLFKDPRICILLPVYLMAFEALEIEPYFIMTYRNPEEVAESLRKRDSFSYDKSFRIWIDYMLRAEKYSRNHPRIFMNYDDILADPLTSVEKIVSAFPLDLTIKPVVKEQIIQFIEPALNHNKRNDNAEPIENESNSKWIYDIFKQLTRHEITLEVEKKFDIYSKSFYSSFGSQKWPKVTVITTVRNEPRALEETILSVVSQDYPNLEYFIIDRNSDNETFEIIEKYKYLLSHWASEPDHGRFDAMNKGLAIVAGQWVTFLNAGDTFLHNGSLWELIRLFPEDCDVVIGDCISDDKVIWNCRKNDFPDHIWKGRFLGMHSFFIRSSLTKKHPFNVRYSFLADLDMALTLIHEKNRIKKISVKVVYSHSNQESDSPFRVEAERYAIIRSHQHLSVYQKAYHYTAFIKCVCDSLIRLIIIRVYGVFAIFGAKTGK
ncbi:MAG: glycosyltransferase [Bacteroidales bacterium]|jgi:glycosyltransferase involved in cell wall biosynthesis|nr:glycosyltransferase [Bacteroidales bacterium]